MRNRGTIALVGALLLLAGVATADAVRGLGDDEPEPAQTSTPTSGTASSEREDDPGAALADAGVEGTLYASVDSSTTCELRAISLPSLATTHYFDVADCGFRVSPDGHEVVFGRRCPADVVDLRSFGEAANTLLRGCAPAWTPDGRLTLVRGGGVVALESRCPEPPECVVTVLSRRELHEQLIGFFQRGVTERFELREIDWFTPTRLVAVVAELPRESEFVVVFERGRALGPPTNFAPRFAHLRVLPFRREAVVATVNGFDVVRPNGDFLGRRSTGDVRALAYAADESAYATATSTDVCVYRSGLAGGGVACLGIQAADLEWR